MMIALNYATALRIMTFSPSQRSERSHRCVLIVSGRGGSGRTVARSTEPAGD
jgi:hypothetical protein